MSAAYRWLHWQPGKIITDRPRHAPSKPSKPGFVGFDGSPQGQSHIILPILESRGADLESRFGRPHARLFHLIGREVQTPMGRGKLLQVFSTRATVDCGRINGCGEPQAEFFRFEEIEPIQ